RRHQRSAGSRAACNLRPFVREDPGGVEIVNAMTRTLAALLVLGLGAAGSAQRLAVTPAQEWRTYDHDLAGTRFSPLTDINAGNVAKLAKAWTFSFPPSPGGRGGPLGLGSSEAV